MDDVESGMRTIIARTAQAMNNQSIIELLRVAFPPFLVLPYWILICSGVGLKLNYQAE